jgi:hypothetical protein
MEGESIMIDEELLIEMIQDAASDYSCDASDRNFEVVVRIKCDDGWTSAEIVKS